MFIITAAVANLCPKQNMEFQDFHLTAIELPHLIKIKVSIEKMKSLMIDFYICQFDGRAIMVRLYYNECAGKLVN